MNTTSMNNEQRTCTCTKKQAIYIKRYYHVPYDDIFEYVAVVVRARRHFCCLRAALHRKNQEEALSFSFSTILYQI